MSTRSPYHFSTTAQGLLERAAQYLNNLWPEYDGFESFLADWLKQAVVIQVPDDGKLLPEREFSPAVADAVRMPHPVMAIEFKMGTQVCPPGAGLERADKRIALAVRLGALSGQEKDYLCMVTRSRQWHTAGPDAIGVTAIFAPNAPTHPLLAWGFAQGLLMWDPADATQPTPAAEPNGVPLGDRPRNGCAHPLPVRAFPLETRRQQLNLSREAAHRDLLRDASDEMGTVWEVLVALNALQAPRTRMEASHALNQKRRQSGEPLLHDVHFLGPCAAPRP